MQTQAIWDILNSATENGQSLQIQQEKKQCVVKFIVFFPFSQPNYSRIKNIFRQCNSLDHPIKGPATLMAIMTVL